MNGAVHPSESCSESQPWSVRTLLLVGDAVGESVEKTRSAIAAVDVATGDVHDDVGGVTQCESVHRTSRMNPSGLDHALAEFAPAILRVVNDAYAVDQGDTGICFKRPEMFRFSEVGSVREWLVSVHDKAAKRRRRTEALCNGTGKRRLRRRVDVDDACRVDDKVDTDNDVDVVDASGCGRDEFPVAPMERVFIGLVRSETVHGLEALPALRSSSSSTSSSLSDRAIELAAQLRVPPAVGNARGPTPKGSAGESDPATSAAEHQSASTPSSSTLAPTGGVPAVLCGGCAAGKIFMDVVPETAIARAAQREAFGPAELHSVKQAAGYSVDGPDDGPGHNDGMRAASPATAPTSWRVPRAPILEFGPFAVHPLVQGIGVAAALHRCVLRLAHDYNVACAQTEQPRRLPAANPAGPAFAGGEKSLSPTTTKAAAAGTIVNDSAEPSTQSKVAADSGTPASWVTVAADSDSAASLPLAPRFHEDLASALPSSSTTMTLPSSTSVLPASTSYQGSPTTRSSDCGSGQFNQCRRVRIQTIHHRTDLWQVDTDDAGRFAEAVRLCLAQSGGSPAQSAGSAGSSGGVARVSHVGMFESAERAQFCSVFWAQETRRALRGGVGGGERAEGVCVENLMHEALNDDDAEQGAGDEADGNMDGMDGNTDGKELTGCGGGQDLQADKQTRYVKMDVTQEGSFWRLREPIRGGAGVYGRRQRRGSRGQLQGSSLGGFDLIGLQRMACCEQSIISRPAVWIVLERSLTADELCEVAVDS
ncbi:unnamed protein product [Polarella glacialis]|uniref:Uncharacterized protein n=1 Tax=Polarella glacialis TaxID=89957 RepID=A0A813IFT2_POLGL|nr:unnamed protein product [Polarella glacialis]